jgi:DNA-binding transcriptional MerR regulator
MSHGRVTDKARDPLRFRPVTIDELARRAGETTRNVRAHQARGLLPPPRLVGRVGSYDERHVERLATIRRLQDRGFSLAAVRELLAARDRGGTLADVLGGASAGPQPPDPERAAAAFERADVAPALRLALVPGPLARRLAG